MTDPIPPAEPDEPQPLSPPPSGSMVVAPDGRPLTTEAQTHSSGATEVLSTEWVSGLRQVSRHLTRPSASEGHLRTELTITARHIDSMVRSSGADDAPWAVAAMSLIRDAAAALEQRRIPDGWELLRAARTEAIEGMSRRDLSIELSQLTGVEVVDDDLDTAQLRTRVWTLRQERNTYEAELERRTFDAARTLGHRAWMLTGLIALGALGVLVGTPSSDSTDALGSLSSYLTIVGLAVAGAGVSHVLFTRNSTRSTSISESANPLLIVLLRLSFGGLVGLLLVVLLQADVQNLLNVDGLAAYPWAILGGFAERYVDRVIDRAESDADAAANEACRPGMA